MSADDNVVKMPDRLERRAQKIEAAIARRSAADEDWRAATVELAIELAGARADHGKDNNAFGRWLEGRFGDNMLPPMERAILIRWGADPEQTRLVLEKTESRSIQGIDRGYIYPNKTPRAKPPGGAKREAAQTYIQTAEALTGKLPPETQVAREAGVSRGTAADVLRDIKSRRSETDAPVKFTKAEDRHVEARIRMLDREREKTFNERVRLGVLEGNADYLAALNQLQKEASEKWERYDTLLNSYKPIFTDAEFTIILTCLHPDNSASPEKRDTAFKAFNAMKLQLTGKK